MTHERCKECKHRDECEGDIPDVVECTRFERTDAPTLDAVAPDGEPWISIHPAAAEAGVSFAIFFHARPFAMVNGPPCVTCGKPDSVQLAGLQTFADAFLDICQFIASDRFMDPKGTLERLENWRDRWAHEAERQVRAAKAEGKP